MDPTNPSTNEPPPDSGQVDNTPEVDLQNYPGLWDRVLDLDIETLFSVDLTNVDLGPVPAQHRTLEDHQVMPMHEDPMSPRATIQEGFNQNTAAAATATATTDTDVAREWKLFIDRTMPDMHEVVPQQSTRHEYQCQYHYHYHYYLQRPPSGHEHARSTTDLQKQVPQYHRPQQQQQDQEQHQQEKVTKPKAPVQAAQQIHPNHPPPVPPIPPPQTRKALLEKELQITGRRLTDEKDYLDERVNRLAYFSNCLAGLREIVHDGLSDTTTKTKETTHDKGLEEWVESMAVLVHDLRVGIDGDERLVRDVEERFRSIFAEIGRVQGEIDSGLGVE